jgi:hypothetical protein
MIQLLMISELLIQIVGLCSLKYLWCQPLYAVCEGEEAGSVFFHHK